MFTPLRRFEFAKMLFSVVPVLVGSAIVSKIFTELPGKFRIALLAVIAVLCIMGFIMLPPNLENESKEPRRR